MEPTKQPSLENNTRKRFLLPVLVLSVFATYISSAVFQLVLLDIASSLNTTAGTASQIPAISRFVGVGVGLVTSFLAIKFKHKSLLLIGLLLSAVGALGNSFAQSVVSMAITDSFRGAGFVIIGAMTLALVAELFPKTKRGQAVGWLQASSFLAFMVSSPVTTIIASTMGWRLVMSAFVFPVAILSFILVFFIVPKQDISQSESKENYKMAYKKVLSNKCVIGCLLAYAANFAASGFLTYYVSFYRIQYGMPLYIGSIIVMVGAAVGATSGIIGGRLLSSVGRKRLGLISAFLSAIFIMFIALMPTLLSSVVFRFAAAFFGSLALVAFVALAIEQVSEYKGTLTSLNTTIGGIGTVLGLTLGGFVLNLFGSYQLLMIMFGFFGLVSMIIFLFLATDSSKLNQDS